MDPLLEAAKSRPIEDTSKMTTKSLKAQNEINIQSLQTLSKTMLIELFSERENENIYSKKIGFSCHFYADKPCGEKLWAHRSEGVAMNLMESHIRSHIEEESKKGQHFFTNSLEFRRKQEEASRKKANALLKKPRKTPPRKGNNPKAGNEAGDRQSSPVTEKKSGKKKGTDDKENQTSDVQFDNERSSPKMTRKSTSSEDSLEAESAQEVEVRQEGDIHVPVPYPDHSYAVRPGRVPMSEPAPSPSATSDSSVSSGVSLEEPGTSPNQNDALNGHPFATQEEIVYETIVPEAMEFDEDKILSRIIQMKKKQDEISEDTKDQVERYITDIKTPKRGENYPLICKICNTGKVFTATSSLVSHYRSHAGIKPFQCYCGLSFTRNHSLKEHGLIHMGQYNCLCEYCNRPFRYKSHYTEHLRTHTGETPFECTECDPVAKYKTRNTYKRHLKTHHGKILSRYGTINLSEEDFAKVRTKKYKKSAATGAAVRKSSSSSESSSSLSPKVEPEELNPPTQQMPVPPVGTILSGLNPVTSHASLGILSTMGAMEAEAAETLLQMNTAGRPQVTLGASQPATSITVCQAPTMTLCQPTGIVSRDAQEQTYYTITGFAPGMVVGSAPNLYGAQPAYQQGSGSGDTDLSDYKLVSGADK